MPKAETPEFSETEVTFFVKDQLGWDDTNRFPAAVYVEHDCDMVASYKVSGRVFYDRAHVRYLPERTCRLEWRDNGEGYPPSVRCSACGRWLDAVADVEDVAQFNHCPLCGARIERCEE